VARPVDDAVLVSRFVSVDGVLMAMPRRQSDRLIVLAHIANSIEAGRELDEPEVNARLRPFSDDVATLRRYLVDAGLLIRRSPGLYRRP
jgi:hypothetical protein